MRASEVILQIGHSFGCLFCVEQLNHSDLCTKKGKHSEYFFCYDENKNEALPSRQDVFVFAIACGERGQKERSVEHMAGRNTKYKNKYADELVEYFMRFLEMRDDPQLDDSAERHGMLTIEIGNDGKAQKKSPPSSGYPSLVKFAIKIGVTPQTLNNWKDKHEEFAEACEFADAIQDEILNERALVGDVDGRVAMKIRELKITARRNAEADAATGFASKFGIEILRHLGTESGLTVKEWDGEVVEDEGYIPKAD